MDRMVELLIEKETLDGDEFRTIVAEFAQIPEKERYSPLLADFSPVAPVVEPAQA